MLCVDIDKLFLHPSLALADNTFQKRFEKHLANKGISLAAYCNFSLPFVFVSHGQKPLLISHHYIYLVARDLGFKELNVIEVTDTNELSQLIDIDRINYSLLHKAVMSKTSLSSAAASLNKRRGSKQICPFCRGPLTGQKSKKGTIIDGKEMFAVSCHYRHYSDGCRFYVLMEKKEYMLFKKNVYPTMKWLCKLNIKCPSCNGDLYERVALNGKVFHQCSSTLKRNNIDCQYIGEMDDKISHR